MRVVSTPKDPCQSIGRASEATGKRTKTVNINKFRKSLDIKTPQNRTINIGKNPQNTI